MKKIVNAMFNNTIISFLKKFNFPKKPVFAPQRNKYAVQGAFSVINFDSTPDRIEDEKDDEYLTVAQLSQRYPAFTQGCLRWLIFNEDKNGFKRVVKRMGRKVILNLTEFKKFLKELN